MLLRFQPNSRAIQPRCRPAAAAKRDAQLPVCPPHDSPALQRRLLLLSLTLLPAVPAAAAAAVAADDNAVAVDSTATPTTVPPAAGPSSIARDGQADDEDEDSDDSLDDDDDSSSSSSSSSSSDDEDQGAVGSRDQQQPPRGESGSGGNSSSSTADNTSSSNASSSSSRGKASVSANLSVQAYVSILQAARRASWPRIARLISSNSWIELSQALVAPPFDTVRAALFYIPWALLQQDEPTAAVAARRSYVDFIDQAHRLAEIALMAADSSGVGASGSRGVQEVQVQQAFMMLNASVEAYLSNLPPRYLQAQVQQ